MPDTDAGLDEQDQSEVFDEDNLDPADAGAPTNEFRTFEELPDVLDVTSADGDADEEAFDEDDLDLDDELSVEGVEPDADPLFGADAARASERDLGADLPSGDEIELVYTGLMEDVKGAQASAAHWEAKRLSDDDINELGYGPEGDDQ